MADRDVLVRLRANVASYNRDIASSAAVTGLLAGRIDSADDSLAMFDKTAGGSTRTIDRFSGRLGLLLDVAGALGPALIPIASVGIPAVTGLASAFGMAALGGGTAVLAFQKVGDAVGALNKARLQPTEANLKAADLALKQLGPDAQHLAKYLSGLTDEVRGLRDAAAGGVLPGVEDAIDSLLLRGPQAERILGLIGDAVGDLLAEGGASIASDRWDDFFNFIATEVPPAITGLGHAVGDLAHAAAELWMAFAPLNSDFLGWLTNAADAIDDWATGLDQTEGFQEFIAYIEENGPQVGQTLGAIAMALLNIVEAAAPIGAVSLPILEAVANVISLIADSDLGTPLVALLALSRTMSLLDRATAGPIASVRTLGADISTMASTSIGAYSRTTAVAERYEKAAARTRETLGKLGKTAGIVGGLTLAQSGLTDEIGLTNTALGASAGLMAGPWGAAVGGGIGALLDFAAASKLATVEAKDLVEQIDLQTLALNKQGYAAIGESLSGYQDALDATGLSLEEVVSASVNGGDELDRVNQTITDYLNGLGPLTAGTADYTSEQAKAASANADQATAVQRLREALFGQNDEVDKATDLARARKAGIDAAADADRDGADAADEYTSSLERMATAVAELNGLLSERKLTRDYNQAWLDINKTIKDNGQVWDKTKAKGIDNLNAVDHAVDVAAQRIELYTEQGRKAAAQRVLTQTLADLRQFAQENPKARDAIQALIDDLKEADKTKAKPKVEVDTAEALHRLDVVHDLLAGLHDKDITVRVNTYRTTHVDAQIAGAGHGGSGKPRAAGGPVKAGMPYIVGERRPELFVPRTDGLILSSVPNSPGTGGGDDELARLPKRLREVAKAFRELQLNLQDGARSIRDELDQLKHDLRENKQTWTDAMRQHAARIVDLAHAYDQQARKLDRQREVLDALIDTGEQLRDAQASFADQVASNFRHDLFGKGLQGVFLQAEADTNDATAFQAVLQQLAAMGLDGEAFKALAASGDLGTAQELAASGMIDAFEAAIGRREGATGGLGGFAGDQAFGKAINDNAAQIAAQSLLITDTRTTMALTQQSVDRLEKTIKQMAGLKGDLQDGAYKGTYRGAWDALQGRNAQVAAGSR